MTEAATNPPRSGRRIERAVVHLVPHTHWDREWYVPFQTFRMRLVELVDGLLDRMAAQPALRFTLDGQCATVDDYLEVRPEAEPRIRRLIAEGRLAIGPWQILMDEFLVSGETIVRNLELGTRRAEELGGAMPVGYLPDMFGHVAQMPQILRRAGIRHAVVWRGVPAAIDRSAFRWRAPDGSTVRAEYLVAGYGSAAHLFDLPERAAERLARLRATLGAYYEPGSVLAMYGTDHAVPTPQLVELVERLNAADPSVDVRIETLAEYVAQIGAAGGDPDAGGGRLPEWTGELRSAARANLLPNVTSTHGEVKAACTRTERLLERYAEPLAALGGIAWPGRYLELAWRRVVENSAHDSICACSHDEVVAQVLARFAEARQIGQGIVDRALADVAARVPLGSWAIVNPSPFERLDLVEIDVARAPGEPEPDLHLLDGRPVATQVLADLDPLVGRFELLGRDVPAFLGRRIHGPELLGRFIEGWRVELETVPQRLVLLVARRPVPGVDVEAVVDRLCDAALARPDEPWELVAPPPEERRAPAPAPAPPLGWTAVRPAPASDRGVSRVEASGTGRAGPAAAGSTRHAAPVADLEPDLDTVVADTAGLRNGRLDVRLAPDGTLRLAAPGVVLEGVGRLVDGGDFGDSYNYGPPAIDELVDTPVEVRSRVVEAGPLRGVVELVRRYHWPLGVEPDGRARTAERRTVDVTTRLELRAGEPFLRVRIAFVNSCTDHRLRWHIPLPRPAATSHAEGQFAVVERGLVVEGGHGEVPVPTFPARGFVGAGPISVLLDQTTEYELVEGHELALTVVRATGLISRNANPFREDPAGPEVPIPSAQRLGPVEIAFAIYPHPGSWVEADVLRTAERYQLPFLVAPGARPAAAPSAAPATREAAPSASTGTPFESPADSHLAVERLRIDGPGVVLSALRRRGEWLELRLVAEHPEPTEACIRGRFDAARVADLLGRPGEPLPLAAPGELRLPLRAWEIRTLQLRPGGAELTPEPQPS